MKSFRRTFLDVLRVSGLLAGTTLALFLSSPAAQAQCGPMDVVFVVDTTGSMGGALSNVTAQLPAIITQIETASGGNFRLGLVEFKDDVIVLNNLATGNTDSVRTNIAALRAGGGGNEPEASDEGVRTVVEGLAASARPAGRQTGDFGAFRPEAAKIIILITDARPAGFDDDFTLGVDDAAAASIAATAASRGILISAVFVPTGAAEAFGVVDTVATIMQNYASVSGGIYLRTESDGTGTADAINDIILNCGGLKQGFVVNATPKIQSIGNDGTATFIITTNRGRVFEGEIELSLGELPEGITATLSPTTIASPGDGSAILTVRAGDLTLARNYIITIIARSGTEVHATTVQLEVFCDPPFIYNLPENQPQNASATSGGSVQLSVTPDGTGPFFYQWYLGPSGSAHFPIEGATSRVLQTPALETGTDFWVRVSNACGSYNSNTATVSVAGRGRKIR